MSYVIGIDGGGMKTEAVVASIEGEILGVGLGGTSNINIASKNEVAESLRNAITKAIEMSKVKGKALIGVLGVAGTERKKCKEIIREIAYEIDFADRIIVTSDATIALFSATGMKPGIIIISGTGSIALGINNRGIIARAGGWGYLLDDEGSGYWIGLKALREVMRMYNGRGSKTILKHAIMEHLNINDLQDLVTMIYTGRLSISEIASISKIVTKCAEMGDEVALNIMKEAGRKLAEMIIAVIKKLNFKNKVNVYYFGGVFNAGKIILEPLRNEVTKNGIEIELKKPKFKPVIGAVLLALKYLNADLDNAWRKINETAIKWNLTYKSNKIN